MTIRRMQPQHGNQHAEPFMRREKNSERTNIQRNTLTSWMLQLSKIRGRLDTVSGWSHVYTICIRREPTANETRTKKDTTMLDVALLGNGGRVGTASSWSHACTIRPRRATLSQRKRTKEHTNKLDVSLLKQRRTIRYCLWLVSRLDSAPKAAT